MGRSAVHPARLMSKFAVFRDFQKAIPISDIICGNLKVGHGDMKTAPGRQQASPEPLGSERVGAARKS